MSSDNLSAQKLSVNPLYHKRSKHIDIRHHFIRDAVNDGNVKLKYLPTSKMMADVLTQSLSSTKHYKFVTEFDLQKLSFFYVVGCCTYMKNCNTVSRSATMHKICHIIKELVDSKL